MDADPLIKRLNACEQAAFVETVGALYEHSPWIAARAWHERPYADREALHAVMQQVVRQATQAEQLALIRAHPDLSGRLARAGDLAPDSAREQAGLGLDRLGAAEFAEFERLNTAYRARFGFPFIIAVRLQTREGVLAAFRARLLHEPQIEHETALAQIGKIAALRLADLHG